MATKDISGQRFGRLTAIEYTGKRTVPGKNAIWLFKCDCGKYVLRSGSQVLVSKIPSCGCYVRDRAALLNKTHGGRHERLYLVWMDMRRRCRDEKEKEYANYGGRGITVCDEWQDYEKFREWALSTGYDETSPRQKCTIDRIDHNGNYEPKNCRWTDIIGQSNNKRNNVIVEYNGRKQTIAQWARELGVDYKRSYKRIKYGWTPERAFFEPPRETKRNIRG